MTSVVVFLADSSELLNVFGSMVSLEHEASRTTIESDNIVEETVVFKKEVFIVVLRRG